MAPPKEKKRRQPAADAGDAPAATAGDAPKPRVVPAAPADEDFPRGGDDGLTALERRELAEAAARDVEHELAEGKQPKAKKPKVAKQAGDAEDAFFEKQAATVEGKLAKHVELLRAKNLQAGTRVWGMVLEVTPRGLVVSLPHGLRGHVAPDQASDVLNLLSAAASGGPGAKKGAALLAAAGGSVPPLTDLFAVGQFVRCVVRESADGDAPDAAPAAAEGKKGGKKQGAEAAQGAARTAKHVVLSLLLTGVQGPLGKGALAEGLALGACVRSVEDHGYTLSFGLKGASGFLPKRDHEAQFGEGVTLQVGGLLDVVVKSVADPRHVVVTCAPGEVAAAVWKEGPYGGGGGLDSLMPGSLINVKVRKVLSNGILVSFLTFFQGTIDLYHLPAASPAAPTASSAPGDWRKAYPEGAKLRARLLYVDPSAKRAGLSLLPHLLSLTLPSPVPMLGSVFSDAQVVRIDPAGGPGLLLRLPDSGGMGGPVPAYAHVSNALDDKVEREAAAAELSKKFKPGTQLPARVIGYRLMDGLAAVTLRPSQVNASILSLSDLSPGMVVAGTVAAVPDRDGEGPLLVALAEGVRGLVPPMHAAELSGAGEGAQRKLGKVKVKVGQKVEARVLEVDPGSRRLLLSLRKGLLAGKAQPLVSATQASPGARFSGVVTGFHDRLGVFVGFFGDLSGAAPHTELGLQPGQTAQDVFAVGQVVKATILSVRNGRLRLSLAPKAAAEAAAAAAATATPAAAAAASPAAAAGGADPLGGLQPGDAAEATVLELPSATAPHYVVRLEAAGAAAGAGGVVRGRLEPAHLSDHPAVVDALKEAVRVGTKLGRVVVLDRLEGQRCLRVSRKPCLLAAAAARSLPASFAEVREGALLPGFVASVTADAVYVRFLAGLTGRAGLPQLADVFVSDPHTRFTEGQSVRAQVGSVDAAKQRFALSLRPSATASSDGAYLLDLFREIQALSAIRAEAEGAAGAAAEDPAKLFPLGSLAGAKVHEVKEYGIVVDMDNHPDVVGLVPSSHTGPAGAAPAPGKHVKGVVLDVVPHQGLVELSLNPTLVGAAKKEAEAKAAAKKLKAGTSVEAVVEGVRPGEYLILSLPSHASLLAYAAVTDYNTPRPDLVPRTFTPGQHVTATIVATPPEAPAGRIVCHVPLTRAAADGAAGAKGAKAATPGKAAPAPKVELKPGQVVEAVVTGIQPHQLDVSVGGRVAGRIHVTEVIDVDVKALVAAAAAAASAAVGDSAAAADAAAPPPKKKARKSEAAAVAANGSAAAEANGSTAAAAPGRSPLDGFRLQQVVTAVVLGRLQGGDGHKRGVIDLSLRPGRLAIAKKNEPQVPPVQLSDLVPGQQVVGYVLEVAEDALWIAAGPAVRGRVAALDASLCPDTLARLSAAFPPGAPVVARVLGVNAKKHTLDLSLLDPCSGHTNGSVAAGSGAAADAGKAPIPAEGALVMGRIVAVSGAGVRVAIGAKRFGRVALTDIHDTWVPDALAGLTEGAYVRARVVGKDGETALLSLRPSRGGAVAGAAARAGAAEGAKGKAGAKAAAAAAAGAGVEGSPAAEVLEKGALTEGGVVAGYVKRCDAKGLFVALDRSRDGHVKLGNLSDGFIEDPAAAFPPGMRLEAKVLKLEGGRIELTLRSEARQPSAASIHSLSELALGQVVPGRVRRVEKFGVFVEVGGNTSLVALAHISELADGPVKDINAAFKPKQAVRAVVTKIDTATNRLSLSLKPSVLAAAEEEAGGAKAGGKRRRAAAEDDIDAEMADADEDGAAGSSSDEDDEGGEGEEGGSEDGQEGKEPESDVAVDDVDVSEEDDDEEGDEDGAMSDEDDLGEDEEDEEAAEELAEEADEGVEAKKAAGGALASSKGRGLTSTGDLDLAAPWGELLLADDPRAGAGAGAAAAAGAGAEQAGKGLSKGAKKRAKEQHEKEIREAELARLSGTAAPTTPADYERLVLASPNSSFVWIKYMALQISLGDVAAARKVADRALHTINYREEGEKFNVWVAWLNLENAYGTPTPEEAASELLKRALQYNDHKKMYMAALGVFERSGRDELAETVARTLTKKFGSSVKVWEKAIERALQKDDGEGARKLMERSLQSLPARKHVKALVRTALAEFRLGSAERGRGILEGVLRNHPKRLDLWNVYIDQEIKTGEQRRVRALFERATHLPLPPKKMKFLFRRYLEYEKEEGDAAAVEHVKKRAMEFVENSLKA
ncbi:hypothetical protein HYH03_004276 [Edaphochlamys debaryana]|uniref:S1 motif domain-containing protein n=1 Tax=Edaphochlamys debaryana TaxID=47281 RepID=A0A835Y8G7_9CHLO|nr:hypothetical protein HYH03_004276 [Edaphochlamys debaryana]|eukprot:KAG2498018.1 hypothetical protein HYH03_004276 [Edaphochlamys debaryana]